jgi:glycosyl transferase family 87
MECGFAAMLAARPAPGRTLPFLILYSSVFVLYLAAVRDVLGSNPAHRWTGRFVMTGACLFRLTFLATAPALSHDLDRYLWDGRVTLSGGNPFLSPPASSGRDTRIEHGEVPTIYPPGAQVLFAAGAALDAGALGMKALVVVADLLVIVALGRLLRVRGQSPGRSLIYAWNPLAVTETAWSGHIEPAALVCVLLAALAIIQKRDARATVALTVGGLVKVFPLVLFVPSLRSMRTRCLLLVPVLFAASYAPFRAAGPRLFAGLRAYADRWLANESLFALVYGAYEWLDPTPRLKGAIAWGRRTVPHSEVLDVLYACVYPIDLAKGTCALAVAVFAYVLWRRRTEPLRGFYLLTGMVLIASPTVHPWYVLWVLPWLALFPSRAFLLLTWLVSLAYANLGAAGRASEPYPWLRLVEYVPFYALLCADWLRGRVPGPVVVPARVVGPGGG